MRASPRREAAGPCLRARRVNAFENLLVSTGGELTLGSNPSIVNAALTVAGGTLTANGSLATSTLALSGGSAALNGVVTGALNMSGGSIRNIAVNAAFFAAESDKSIAMNHLLQAAQAEAAKRDRTISDAEIRGWI